MAPVKAPLTCPSKADIDNVGMIEAFLDLKFFPTDLGNRRWRVAVKA
jgi:hypothetical protein